MQCKKCGQENLDGAQLCQRCGTTLGRRAAARYHHPSGREQNHRSFVLVAGVLVLVGIFLPWLTFKWTSATCLGVSP